MLGNGMPPVLAGQAGCFSPTGGSRVCRTVRRRTSVAGSSASPSGDIAEHWPTWLLLRLTPPFLVALPKGLSTHPRSHQPTPEKNAEWSTEGSKPRTPAHIQATSRHVRRVRHQGILAHTGAAEC